MATGVERYGMVVSDATGVHPEDGGSPERLAFLFRWARVGRTELACDISIEPKREFGSLAVP